MPVRMVWSACRERKRSSAGCMPTQAPECSRTLADMFVADEDTDTLAWFAQAQRMSASPDMAAKPANQASTGR